MNSVGGHAVTLRALAGRVTVHMEGGVIDGKRVVPRLMSPLSWPP